MESMISAVEMYLQTIVKKKDFIENDSQILELIGVKNMQEPG